jgi:hypothetical protein
MVSMEERKRLLFPHVANENRFPRRRTITVVVLILLRFMGWLGGFLYLFHGISS